MGGELGIKIKSIRTDGIANSGKNIDLTMISEDGQYLHVCGDNDWGYFALDMLKPIYEYAENLISDVKTRIARIGDKPEAIILGINQQRIMDIYCGGKGKCTEIAGIPIARSKEFKAFRYVGNIHDKGNKDIDCPF